MIEQTDLALLQKPNVLQPHLPRPSILSNVREREFKRLGDQDPRLGGVDVDGIDASDVVKVELPERNGGGGAETAGKDGLDERKVTVLELEVGVGDPLLSLEQTGGQSDPGLLSDATHSAGEHFQKVLIHLSRPLEISLALSVG